MPEKAPLEIHRDQLTVAEKITYILDALRHSEGELDFEELFRESRTVSDVVVTFLALLELMRLRMVRAWQAVPGGRISVSDIRPDGEGAAEAAPEEGGDGDGGEEMYAAEESPGDRPGEEQEGEPWPS